ncbi:MAG: plasmid mobilization relaxosome protein MobC [Peptoniphilaceae bacterium]|nr:plasmid mobilization relaxosome protein MobC [Peptoniphilaceae bacterium]
MRVKEKCTDNRTRKNQLKIYLTDEEKEIYIVDLEPFRDLQWLLSNATNNINQVAKATNITGVIYKKDIDYLREEIENLAKEIWDIHSLLLNRNK